MMLRWLHWFWHNFSLRTVGIKLTNRTNSTNPTNKTDGVISSPI